MFGTLLTLKVVEVGPCGLLTLVSISHSRNFFQFWKIPRESCSNEQYVWCRGEGCVRSPENCVSGLEFPTGFGVRFQFLQNRKLQGFLYRNSDRFFCQCVSVFTGHAGPSPGAQERTFTCTCSKLKFRSLTCTCTCTYTCTMTSGCRDLDSFKNQGSSRKLANRAAVQGFHQILVV